MKPSTLDTEITMNAYEPFRRCALTQDELKAYSTLKPQIVIRDTLILWVQIVVVVLFAAFFDHWAVYLVASPLIGTRYYALYIIGHDGLHRRLFVDKTVNDLWNDVLILGPIGAITRLNRSNHMIHHRSMGNSIDPDRHKYIRVVPMNLVGFILDFLGFRYVMSAVKNVFFPHSHVPTTRKKYTPRDFIVLFGWQFFLFFGLTYLIGFWAYFLLWWGSIYIFTFCADVARVFLEHAQFYENSSTNSSSRLITYTPNFLESMLFAPMNMNCHVTHHLWPNIPYYHLQAATEKLRRSRFAKDVVWRTSYWKQLIHTRGRKAV